MSQNFATLQEENDRQNKQDPFALEDDTDSNIESPTTLPLSATENAYASDGSSSSQLKKWLIRITLLSGLIVAGYFAATSTTVREMFASNKNANTKYNTDKATRGPFRITVVERGQLDSMNNATLTNQVRGTTTIIKIAAEGTPVKEGDIVCELDSSKLEDKKISQELSVSAAKANWNTASSNVQVQKLKNESDQFAAKLKLELADLDLKKYKEGEYLQQENESKGTVTVAQLSLTKAKESYEFTKRLAKKGYKTQIEVEADRIAVTEAQIKLDSAQGKLMLLQKFTYDRTIKELTEKARDAKSDLKRVILSGAASLAQYESTLASRELSYKVEVADMERVIEQIGFCTMRAPQDGEVVYVEQSSRRGSESSIEEGTSVRERQEIIKLPDFSKMKVNARIHESRISLVREGLQAAIRVDAVPGKVFKGVVSTVSPVPVAGSWFRPDLKEYEVEIEIRNLDIKKDNLKPGLTAEVEILVEEADNVLTIPMQAILGIGTKQYAYILAENGTERRVVKTGRTNGQVIEILEGIKEGEIAILNPRSSFGTELKRLEAEQKEKEDKVSSKSIKKKNKRDKKKRPKPTSRGNEKSQRGKPKGEGQPQKSTEKKKRDPAAMLKKLDANGDGKITLEEAPDYLKSRFSSIDSNGDGSINASELTAALKKMKKPRR